MDCVTTSVILDDSIKVWDKQDEYTDSICFVSAIQAAVGGSTGVGGIFRTHFGALIISDD